MDNFGSHSLLTQQQDSTSTEFLLSQPDQPSMPSMSEPASKRPRPGESNLTSHDDDSVTAIINIREVAHPATPTQTSSPTKPNGESLERYKHSLINS